MKKPDAFTARESCKANVDLVVLSSKGVLIITGCLTERAHACYYSEEHNIGSLKADTVSVLKLLGFSFPDKK